MSTTREDFLILVEKTHGESQLKLHVENLEKVNITIGEKPLSIISVVGTSPQHKNYLLGYIILYLKTLEDNNNVPIPLSGTLHGFLWKDECRPAEDISATWIFKTPFTIKNENGQEISVILLYTQFPSEASSSLSDKMLDSIVGLNIFISSTCIIDIFRQTPQKLIKRMDSFIKCGLLGVGQENSSKSFQNLSLFVRDWSYPADFPYGGEGGAKYINKIFSQSSDSKKVKENIEKHFETFNCHLAPFAGSRAVSAGFTGLVEELEPVYCKTVENFIRNFVQDNLALSKIHGELVRSNSIVPVVESFIRTINYGSSPRSLDGSLTAQPANEVPSSSKRHNSSRKKQKDSQSLNKNKPLAELQNGVEFETPIPNNSEQSKSRIPDQPAFPHEKVIKKALEKFKGSFSRGISETGAEYTFPETVTIVYKNAVKLSREMLKKDLQKLNTEIEDKTLSKTLEKKLKKDAEKELESFKQKNENMRRKFINEIVTSYVGRYNALMSISTSNMGESQHEKVIEIQSNQAIENLKQDVVEKYNLSGESKDEILQELERKLNEEYAKLLSTKQKEAEPSPEFLQTSFTEALSEYKRFMNDVIQNENSDFASKSLEIWHMEAREKSFRKLKSKVGSNNNPLLNQLATVVETTFQEIKKKYDALQENRKSKTNDLVKHYEQQYSNELKENESKLVSEGLHAKHKDRLGNILADFQEKCGYPVGSRQLNSFVDSLSQRLTFLFSAHVKVLAQLKKERESNIEIAFEKAMNFYNKEMEEILKINYFLDDEELEAVNQGLLEKSSKIYQDALKAYSIPLPEAPPVERLNLKLSKDYREYKTKNGQKRNLSFSETKNLVTECVKLYNYSVSKGMVLVWNKETLEKLHQESLQEAISKLKNDCVKKNDPDFLSPYLEELEYEIEGAFEEIEQMYEFKSSAEADTINAALAKGREVYNDEMDKHVRNHEFIRPNVLEDLHKQVSARAIKHCFENNAFLKDSNRLQLQEGMNLIFEKYKQQNDMNLETEPAIGIDLGTTYSCVAIYAKGKVHIIPNGIGKNTTPSYVAFTKDGKENIGEPAKNRAYENPENTIFDAKRIIGRRFNDACLQNDMKLWPFTVVDDFGVPKILAGGKKLHPEEISAKLLRELKKDAERYLQRDVRKAVITVPAYFTDGQRQATKDAGLMAGLEVLTVQTEPTAAAIAYKLQHSEGKDRNVLIFDLGGGTFDVAVLKMSKGKIEVLAVDGDTHLGGEDFDKNMMEYCAEEFKKKHKVDLFEGKDSASKQTKDEARRRLKRLQGECERKKIELATSIAAVVTVDRMHGRTDLSVSVTREMFNKLNENLFKKTIQVVDKALVAAKLQKSKIDDIVLVGGSTRIPKVQEMLGAHFGGKALDHYINPDEAVAYGAAMTAAYMNGTIVKNSMDFNKVQDVTPMSIGVEVYGGGFSVIIPKSTKVPVKLMERYKTAHNNQTSVQITIYQGEDPIAVHNQHLGDFYLNGIPPRAAEVENIDVEMVINSQGILHVSAVSSSTGHKSVSIIENKFRMGSGAIQRFLDEAPA